MNPRQYIPLTVFDYLQVYIPFLLGTAVGLTLLGVGLFLFFFALANQRAKWAWLACAVYAATLQFGPSSIGDNRLLFPFGALVIIGRPLTLLFLFLMLIPAFQAGRGVRGKLVSAPVVAFMIYEIIFSLMLGFGGDSVARGAMGGLVFLMIFYAFCVGLSKWMQQPEQVYTALKAVLVAAGIVVFGTALHVAARPSAILISGRMTGTSSNPQVLGGILAFSLPATYGLLFRKGESKAWRVYLIAALAFSLIFLIWTGSRGGVLIALVGIIAFYRRRLGQFLLISLVLGCLVLVGLQFFGESATGGAHLLATNNSRSEVFERLITSFLSHPIAGEMTDTVYGETTYLSTAAAFGILGLIPLGVFLWLWGRDSIRLLRRRNSLGRHAVLLDIVFATCVEVIVGSAFDNHMMGTLTFVVFLFYVCLTIYTALSDPAVFDPALGGADFGAYNGGYGAYGIDGEMGEDGAGYGAGAPMPAPVGYDDYSAWSDPEGSYTASGR